MVDQPAGGGMQDLVTVQGSGVRYLGQLIQIFQQLFPRITGTFTMSASTSKAVADTRVQANSIISLQATNAAAGTLQGSAKSLYISNVSPGVGFTVTTANATNAAGTEIFSYFAFNPV